MPMTKHFADMVTGYCDALRCCQTSTSYRVFHRMTMTTGDRFERAVNIMARLRGPGGCPWDREQSFDTIRKYTLEECYEVLAAIERRNWPDLCEELGDLLLQVIFYAQMANEAGHFSIADVIAGLNRKLI